MHAAALFTAREARSSGTEIGRLERLRNHFVSLYHPSVALFQDERAFLENWERGA